MITYQILAGTVDVSVVIRIIDSTDGTPETGVVFNTSGIALEYRRELAASTAITEATLAALTTAHADGGFLHIGNGYYRLDLPDAACATGVAGCLVHGTVTGMVVIGCYINLTPVPADVRQWLGTAAATPTVAGVPEVDLTHVAGATTNVAALATNVDAILTDTGTTLDGRLPAALVGGRIDANVGAISSDATAADNAEAFFDGTGYAGTGNTIPTVTTVGTLTTYTGNTPQTGDSFARIGATGSGLTTLATQASVNTIDDLLDTEVAAIITTLGTPAGVSISADIAAIEAQTDDIGVAGAGLTALATQASVDAIDDFLDTEVAAIKTQTDKLTFTVANVLDANVQRINDVAITGDGSGTPFGV